MIKKTAFRLISITVIFLLFTQQTQAAQRLMEGLGRGVVAVRSDASNVFVSWRLLGLDPTGIGFNLYRSENGGSAVKLNGFPLTGGTNYTDTNANLSVSNSYYVRPVISGVEQKASASWTLPANAEMGPVIRIPLKPPYDRVVKFVWVGDADGDGEYELFVSFKGASSGQSQQLEAYKMDGTFLWEVDFGPNSVDPDGVYPNAAAIVAGQWDGITVYDLDSDGHAEVIIKSANGVKFGNGKTLSYGDNVTQFISVLDGMTGAEKARTRLPNPWLNDNNYPLGTLFGIGYPDGVHPSLMIHAKSRAGGSGTPFNIINSSWDYRNGQITKRWSVQWGAYDSNKVETAHSMRVVDLDQNGTDELISGMHAINANGTLRWNLADQGVYHGDRFHIGDFDPNRSGLEMYGIQQNNPYGLIEYFADASRGQLLWNYSVGGKGWDAARGVASDIDPRHPGMEVWSFNGVRSATGSVVSSDEPYPNLQVWWDGDLLAENLHNERIEKWDYKSERTSLLINADDYGSLDGARDVPAFYGDILGDWREEVIYGHWARDQLIVMTSPYPTNTRLYTLAHNPAYRNCMTIKGYYQSNQLDYFLGDGMSTPPTPAIRYVNASSDVSSLQVELESLSSQRDFSPFEVKNTSGAQYIVWPGSGGILKQASESTAGQVAIKFTLSQTADVEFQIRVNMPNGDNDSFYYKIDSGEWSTQNNVQTSDWSTLTPTTFRNLSSGSHTLTIKRREDGTCLDLVTLIASAGVIAGSSPSSGNGGESLPNNQITGLKQLINRGTGMYLDGLGRTTNGADAGQFANTSHRNAHWNIVDADSGYHYLINQGTDMRLDGYGRTTNGSACAQYRNTTHPNAQWRIVPADPGYYYLVNRSTGMRLDGYGQTNNGSSAMQYLNTTHPNAQWQLVESQTD